MPFYNQIKLQEATHVTKKIAKISNISLFQDYDITGSLIDQIHYSLDFEMQNFNVMTTNWRIIYIPFRYDPWSRRQRSFPAKLERPSKPVTDYIVNIGTVKPRERRILPPFPLWTGARASETSLLLGKLEQYSKYLVEIRGDNRAHAERIV